MEDIITVSNNLTNYIDSLCAKKKIIKKPQTTTLISEEIKTGVVKYTKYIKINAYFDTDKHAYFYSGYKSGDNSADYFYKLLNEKKVKHLEMLDSEVNYKTPFDHLGFTFKSTNLVCYDKNKNICTPEKLADKAVTLILLVNPYEFSNDDKKITGLTIKVKSAYEK
jgi:hypothetical protein